MQINIICILLVIFFVLAINEQVNNQVYGIDKIINNSNSVYVDVTRFITRENDSSNEYLKKLGKYYDLNIAITDLDGNIIYKTDKVNSDYIDLNFIRDIMQGRKKTKEVYQHYDIKLDGTPYKLVVWRTPIFRDSIYISENTFILILITPAFIAILLLYFFINKKVKYIKTISSGIGVMSQGQLNYSIPVKGVDELSLLASDINDMSSNLKSKIEEEKAAEKMKSELITNVSHDLRTPLTALIAYLKLLEDEKIETDDRQKFVSIATEKAENIKILIDDLFEYSKLESGGAKLNTSKVNIIEIIEQCIGEFSIISKDKNINFSKKYNINNIQLNIDPFMIGRVFENLISNAIKYSEGNSSVDIGIVDEGTHTIISFSNYAKNISGEEKEKLFERFYRGDKSRNSETGGAGLGLSIAKSIINLHQGEIWLEVQEDVFTVYIKLPNNTV